MIAPCPRTTNDSNYLKLIQIQVLVVWVEVHQISEEDSSRSPPSMFWNDGKHMNKHICPTPNTLHFVNGLALLTKVLIAVTLAVAAIPEAERTHGVWELGGSRMCLSDT